jgi:hypothetical protein
MAERGESGKRTTKKRAVSKGRKANTKGYPKAAGKIERKEKEEKEKKGWKA